MSKKFLKGTLIGAIVGGIAGLLFAPKSGQQTRADIKRQAKTAKTSALKRVNQIEKVAKAKVRKIKSEAVKTKKLFKGGKK